MTDEAKMVAAARKDTPKYCFRTKHEYTYRSPDDDDEHCIYFDEKDLEAVAEQFWDILDMHMSVFQCVKCRGSVHYESKKCECDQVDKSSPEAFWRTVPSYWICGDNADDERHGCAELFEVTVEFRPRASGLGFMRECKYKLLWEFDWRYVAHNRETELAFLKDRKFAFERQDEEDE